MTWEEMLREVPVLARGGEGRVGVAGVQYDSRRIGAGDMFVAMLGASADGNRFVEATLRAGAVGVLTDSRETFAGLRASRPELPVALVERGRRALAGAAAALLGHPERRLAVCAVTGTNGKTTTAYLLEQMLRSVGRTCVLLGTIETHVGEQVRASEHTTPEVSDVLRVFADGVRAGATEALMEMSSHALEQERVWGIPVDVGIFTNLTQDHLDYHGTMETYFSAKARMFEGVGAGAPRVAVVNGDDLYGVRVRDVARGAGSEVWGYGLEDDGGAEYCAGGVRLGAGETRFVWRTPRGAIEMRSTLTGRVNVYNLLAAACAALARGLTLEQIAAAAGGLRQVPGRFQVVDACHTGITVVVDYAHTEDALKNLIGLGRELVRGHGGRVITVFGCGGDRDRGKRAKMGRIAAEESDVVVVTSDNPRSEAPGAIIAEILEGVRDGDAACIVEEDRAGAIGIAVRAARRGDIVLVAGKGHEKLQVFGDGAVPFDDVAVAENVLRGVE